MPPKTSKTSDLDALARAIRVSILLGAGALAGCQTSGHMASQDASYKPAAPRAVDVQFNPAYADDSDIWVRVRHGFQLQADATDNNPRIERQRLWYVSNQDFIEQATERGGPYMHYVVERLEARNMPLELALLPMIESAYNPLAISRAQAVGLWQFMPATGTHFNLRQTSWYDGRRDIKASTNAALTYLDRLHDMFNGDWLLALAAYNAGEGTVSRAIERNQRLGLPTDYWNLSLPQETQDYVPKLLALSQLVMSPQAYGINLNPIANEAYFKAVKIKPGLDLNRIAALADVDADELYQLNPAFTRRVTLDGPQQVLVPKAKAATLKAGLATLKPQELVSWKQYKVRRGDSLASIAKRFDVSVAELKNSNRLGNGRLRHGQALLIPGRGTGNLAEPASPPQLARAETRPAPSRTYKVKSGENLWQIARSTGVGVDDLKRWNNLDSHGIKPGQTLKLQSGSQLMARASSNDKAQKPKETATYYKVQRGDSMYLIAKRFNVEMQHIKRWNPRSAHALKPGQTLTLYLDTASR